MDTVDNCIFKNDFTIKQEPLWSNDDGASEQRSEDASFVSQEPWMAPSDLLTSSTTCSFNEAGLCSTNPIKQEIEDSINPTCERDGSILLFACDSVNEDRLRLKFGIKPSFVMLTRTSYLPRVKVKIEENETHFEGGGNSDDLSRTEYVCESTEVCAPKNPQTPKKRFVAHNTTPIKRKMRTRQVKTKRLTQSAESTPVENRPTSSPDGRRLVRQSFHHILGDFVWAKLQHKPWWPAQICAEPKSGDFKKIKITSRAVNFICTPHYYVSTFDTLSASCWVSANYLMKFRGKKKYEDYAALLRHPSLKNWFRVEDSFRDKWEETVKKVEELHKLERQERSKDLNASHFSKEIAGLSELLSLEKQALNTGNERINLPNPVVNKKSVDETIQIALKERERDNEEKRKTEFATERDTNESEDRNDRSESNSSKKKLTLNFKNGLPKPIVNYKSVDEAIRNALRKKKAEKEKPMPKIKKALLDKSSKQISKTPLTEMIKIPTKELPNIPTKTILGSSLVEIGPEGYGAVKNVKPVNSVVPSTNCPQKIDKTHTNTIKCEIKNGIIVIRGSQQRGFHALMTRSASDPNLIIQATLTIDKIVTKNVSGD